MINNGYHVLQNIKSISFNNEKELIINNRKLQLTPKGLFFVQNEIFYPNVKRFQNFKSGKNPNIFFSQAKWADGSTAIFDSRGVLHLKSSNTSIPEISLLFIIGKATPCWASNGHYSGSSYFNSNDSLTAITPVHFHKLYFEKFIACLQ